MARKRKRRGKIRIKQRALIQKKDSVSNDTLRRDTFPRMKAQMPRTVGTVFKVKIKKKR